MMRGTEERLAAINWQACTDSMNQHGYALVPGLLEKEECDVLIRNYDAKDAYRKTVVMERYRFGLGEYKYFNYPLPTLIQGLRERIYPHLVPVANEWMNVLGMDKKFPNALDELHEQCRVNNQVKATPLILKYGKGGFNTLHQDLYGDVFFPMQAVLFLKEPDIDYTGGEFVLLQQTPRAQSKAMVLRPKLGDMLIFTTSFKPVKGSRGYYKVNMKHGVSEVLSGERYTLGILFHDAVN